MTSACCERVRTCVRACMLNLNQPALSLLGLYMVFMHPFFSLRPKIRQQFIHNFRKFLLNYTKFIYRINIMKCDKRGTMRLLRREYFYFLQQSHNVYIQSQDSGNFSVGQHIPLKFFRQFQIRKLQIYITTLPEDDLLNVRIQY